MKTSPISSSIITSQPPSQITVTISLITATIFALPPPPSPIYIRPPSSPSTKLSDSLHQIHELRQLLSSSSMRQLVVEGRWLLYDFDGAGWNQDSGMASREQFSCKENKNTTVSISIIIVCWITSSKAYI